MKKILASPVERITLAIILFAAFEALLILFIDRPLSEYFHTIDTRYTSVIDIFRFFTDLGLSKWYLWPTGIGAIVCVTLSVRRRLSLKRRNRWLRRGWGFTFVFVCVGLSGVITDIIKPLIGRARPVLLQREDYYGFDPFNFHAAHNSFPSGHATTAFALAFALIALRPGWRPWFIVFAIAVAVSRVVVNAHYLSDIIAGALVGMLTALLIQKLFIRQHWIAPPDDAARVKSPKM